MKIFWIVFPFVFVALLAYGPLFPPGPPATSAVVELVGAAPDLDSYLADGEAKVEGVKPDLAKRIVWANPQAKEQTPYALVYIHGFSASHAELAPLPQELARDFGANLFLTRLKAHGLKTSDEFGRVAASDWIDDAREALAIGRRIGKKVILLGMSTGAALALELAYENENSKDIAALILISPNHDPADPRVKIISGPFGPLLARVLIGREREWKTDNEEHAYQWTNRYPSRAIASLMDLINLIRGRDLSKVSVPTLVLYTSKDDVVNVPLIRKRFEEMGSPMKKLIDFPPAKRHEFAGRALAPEVVEPAKKEILSFLSEAHVRK